MISPSLRVEQVKETFAAELESVEIVERIIEFTGGLSVEVSYSKRVLV